jgi:hypothetical protein
VVGADAEATAENAPLADSSSEAVVNNFLFYLCSIQDQLFSAILSCPVVELGSAHSFSKPATVLYRYHA